MCLTLVSISTWRALTAEFLGTMLFVFASSSFSCSWGDYSGVSPHISLATGLSYATLIQCTRKSGGGHLNPAVTVAYYLTDEITCCKAFGYILTQLVGGKFDLHQENNGKTPSSLKYVIRLALNLKNNRTRLYC